MPRNLYVTAMEPHSGKSVVALGLMELLAGRVERLGFFRPVVGSEPDPRSELMRSRYESAVAHALTAEEASTVQPYADLANELGAPVLVVVRGGPPEQTAASVRVARAGLETKGCELFGVVVNRIPPEHLEGVRQALADADVYLLAETPELAYPTVAEVADQLGARIVLDPRGTLQREVRDVRIAAMSVEHFVEHLVEDALVIVPADRPDILVATLASAISPEIPAIAGVLLTGGQPLAEGTRRLLAHAPFP